MTEWAMFWAGAYIVPAIWTAIMSYADIAAAEPEEAKTPDAVVEAVLCGLFWPLLRVTRLPM